MKNILNFSFRVATWLLLYYGVWLQVPGAWNLFVAVQITSALVVAVLCLITAANVSIPKKSEDKPQGKLSKLLAHIYSATTMGLLVWLGHSAVASLFAVMYVAAWVCLQVLKERREKAA